MNKDAVIEMKLVSKGFYMLVAEATPPNAEYTLGHYMEFLKKVVEPMVTSAEFTEVSDTVINGFSAKQFEMSGTLGQVETEFFITALEHDGMFYQLTAWADKTKYAEAKPVFDGILETITFGS